MHLHPRTASVTGAAQAAHRLHPAEHFFNPLADPLADGVARMTHGSLLIPAMALATEHLGFAYTSWVLQSHPFTFARQISTLDHLTKGRVAWNIVASYLESSGRNFRRTGLLDHDERIEEALRSLRGEPRHRELGTLNRYLWAFVVGELIVNVPRSLKDLPAETALSHTLSKDLVRRGFRFVGRRSLCVHAIS
jgi:hypothetical protein